MSHSKFWITIVGLVAVASLLLHLIPQPITNHIQAGDKVCIDGGGYFPYGMPGPSPFLVCGVIDAFDPEVETVPPPLDYTDTEASPL